MKKRNSLFAHHNLKELLDELSGKGVKLEQVPDTNILLAKKGKVNNIIIDSYTSLVPFNIGLAISNKNVCRHILQENKLPVAPGELFAPQEKNKAIRYARQLTYPVLIRQENSQRNEKAIPDIDSDEKFNTAYTSLSQLGENILVEKMFAGQKMRVFLSRSGFLHVLKKDNYASLSTSFIAEEKENDQSWRQLESTSKNIYTDMTDDTHKSLLVVAKKILEAFPPMPYICFEIIAKNMHKPFLPGSYVIAEIYHSYALHLSYNARKATTEKKVSQMIAELMFP